MLFMANGIILFVVKKHYKSSVYLRAGPNVKTIPPNVKYKDKFLKAFKFAKETKRGLWDE